MIDDKDRINLDRVRAIKAALNKVKYEIETTENQDLDVASHIDAALRLFGDHNASWLLATLKNGGRDE